MFLLLLRFLVQIIDLFLVFITVMQKLFIIYYIMISSMIITLSLDAMFFMFWKKSIVLNKYAFIWLVYSKNSNILKYY